MNTNTNTNLEDFLAQKEKEKEQAWENHIFGLITEGGNSELISFIEKNCFFTPEGRTGEPVDLSSEIPWEVKMVLRRDLKMMLLIYESDDVIKQVDSVRSSFDGEFFKGN